MTDQTTELAQPEDVAALGFVGALMHRSHLEPLGLANSLVDSYKTQAERAETTLNLVRRKVVDLISGQWMPTTYALEAALFPRDEEVNAACAAKDIG